MHWSECQEVRVNSVRRDWCIHECIINTKMILWCTCSKKQKSKMWCSSTSYLICTLFLRYILLKWKCTSVLSLLWSISLPFISMHNMSTEMLYVLRMHYNTTSHIHKGAPSRVVVAVHCVPCSSLVSNCTLFSKGTHLW